MVFFSRVPALWIGTSNVNTPIVTSQIPHFGFFFWEQCRSVLGAQDGIEDWFFMCVISRHFWMDYSMPKRFSKAQPTTGPHPTSLTMIRLYPPLMAGFSWEQRFFNRQKWRVLLLTQPCQQAPLGEVMIKTPIIFFCPLGFLSLGIPRYILR